jgi:predicted MFS family arabinose efflux permease
MVMERKWGTVWLLATVAAVNYADRTSLSAVYPLLRRDLGLSDVELGILGTLFLWSYAAGSLVAGLVADRCGRHRVVTLSLLGWSLVTLASGWARTAQELMASRVLLGLTECFYLPAAIALIAGHHGPETRGRAMALHVGGLNLGLVGGAGLAGYLGDVYGWRASLWVLGAAGVILSAFSALWLHDGLRRVSKEPAESWRAPLRRLRRNQPYLLLATQAMLVAFGVWMFFHWMPLHFQERFGLSLALAGISGTAVLQLSAVAGALFGGALSDRLVKRGTPARLKAMSWFYFAAAPCLAVFLLPGGLPLVAAGVIVFSFVKALAMANEPPALCEAVDGRDRATAQSLMNALNTIAGGLGVLVAGSLKAAVGLSGVFASVGLLVLIAGYLSRRAARM